jgi:hypothetical protein
MAELPKRRRRRGHLVATALVSLLACSREAHAQIHWDAGVQAGVSKRFLADRAQGTPDAGFGPTATLTGHVALLPLVRIGAYFGHEISPLGGDVSARQITFGGLHLKGMLPWVRSSTSARAWIFAGFGYAGVYAPSFETNFYVPSTDGTGGLTREHGRVEGGGGGFFDVPFGVGASYKFFKPWELFAELGGRAEFGNSGTIYEPPGAGVRIPGDATQRAAPPGLDRFAVGLTLGVLVDF